MSGSEVGTREVFTVSVDTPNSAEASDVVILQLGGVITYGPEGAPIETIDLPSGYSIFAGGVGFQFVTFRANAPGARDDNAIGSTTGGDGAYSLVVDVQGTDE